MIGAVASQPSLPLGGQSALHMGAEEVSQAKRRLDREGPMLAVRFDGDSMCSLRKFEAIAKTFNDDGAERVKLDSLPGDGHSVLTIDFINYVVEKFPFRIRTIRTDRGHEFQALFHWHVADLSMEHAYIKPRTPQLNGKVERSHRTDKDEF